MGILGLGCHSFFNFKRKTQPVTVNNHSRLGVRIATLGESERAREREREREREASKQNYSLVFRYLSRPIRLNPAGATIASMNSPSLRPPPSPNTPTYTRVSYPLWFLGSVWRWFRSSPCGPRRARRPGCWRCGIAGLQQTPAACHVAPLPAPYVTCERSIILCYSTLRSGTCSTLSSYRPRVLAHAQHTALVACGGQLGFSNKKTLA